MFFTTRRELQQVLFLAPSVCGFLFTYEMALEPLNGFVPKIHTEDLFGPLLRTASQGQMTNLKATRYKKRHFWPFQWPACGLCLVKQSVSQ